MARWHPTASQRPGQRYENRPPRCPPLETVTGAAPAPCPKGGEKGNCVRDRLLAPRAAGPARRSRAVPRVAGAGSRGEWYNDGVSQESLRRYRDKRRFEATPEPAGEADTKDAAAGNRFVVQNHAARRLHYDVRLEVDGVMASWAVPKGPSYDPKVKRLAVHVEDHPLDYRTFEGNIPGGQYGAGSVIVWDEGTYRNLTERDGKPVSVRDAIEAGHLSVWLEGHKLKGGWSFTRTGRDGDQWIMVKRRDERADPSLDIETAAPASVLSGRLIEEVAADPDAATWTREKATFHPPMLATLLDAPSWLAQPHPGWSYERKLDGLRCVAVRNDDQVELWSRNHKSFNARFPGVVAALADLPVDNFTLDGELVAFDSKDFLGFGALQQHGSELQVRYCVFDVMHLLGRDVRGLPLTDRKKLLGEAVEEGPDIWLVDELSGDPTKLLAKACAKGWEGLVAKRRDSIYTGDRSRDWCKLKCSASQEMVIGGWTEPRGSRTGLGALLVGYYDGGQLRYAGKVGTGFSMDTLASLSRELRRLERPNSPFVDAIRERTAHWVEPRLVANIAFTEWTRDGRLRHPRFEGLRPDKDPTSVVREQPAEP
jgi:bifunctional non-homologous end joining protein LigD